MSLSSFGEHRPQIALLQSSLDAGRLGHAYLFSGESVSALESVARTLAKVLNCQNPPAVGHAGLPLDCCDTCSSCKRIDAREHPDVHELRPESKLRQIRIEQIRELIRAVHLKSHEARFKVAIVSWADRLNDQASNAFLKTLEEPPPTSLLLLLTTEPSALLDTIRSRCLHLAFGEGHAAPHDPGVLAWLESFVETVAQSKAQPLARYRLLSLLLTELANRRKAIEKQLSADSPLQKYADIEAETEEKLASELNASIEAEYRQQRGEVLGALLWWLRDVWLLASGTSSTALGFPNLQEQSTAIARRISPKQALDNLRIVEQTHLMLARSNVQETLALETSLLKLDL